MFIMDTDAGKRIDYRIDSDRDDGMHALGPNGCILFLVESIHIEQLIFSVKTMK